MRTITVTIGRNIGNEPMAQGQWNAFTYSVREALQSYVTEWWATGAYKGSWEGIGEDAMFYYGPLRNTVDERDLAIVKARLATLATQYGQEAIGVSVGESELVESFGAAETFTETTV